MIQTFARLLSTLSLYRSGYNFKKLFTISEYYDKNRAEYYKSIQSVRMQDFNMTSWLEYFTQGLSSQLQEVKELGRQAIEQDLYAKENHLSQRQNIAVEYKMKNGSLRIQEFVRVLPEEHFKESYVNKNIMEITGATSNLEYNLKK